MSVDWFLKLKEIDSLSRMKINYLKIRVEQKERIFKLNNRLEATLTQLAKVKQESVTINSDLAETEKKLKTASEQKQRLIDRGTTDEKKILQYSLEILQQEELGMEFLLRLDEIEIEIQEAKTFLQGLKNSINEIQLEINPELEKIEGELNNIDLRSNLLLNELPPDYRTLLEKTTSKNLSHGPFTRIDQGSCYFCRFKISRLDESEIDMQKNLKTCPQCSRIFLPYGS